MLVSGVLDAFEPMTGGVDDAPSSPGVDEAEPSVRSVLDAFCPDPEGFDPPIPACPPELAGACAPASPAPHAPGADRCTPEATVRQYGSPVIES